MRRFLWTSALLVAGCMPARPSPSVAEQVVPTQAQPPEQGAESSGPIVSTLSGGGSGSVAHDADETDSETVADETLEEGANQEGFVPAAPHPLATLSDAELRDRLTADPRSLGSLSIGSPSAGALVGGVQLPERPYWRCMMPEEEWGTTETIAYLEAAFTAFSRRQPNSQPLPIGDISAPGGGPLLPHRSHQSGRDVDLGLYYRDNSPWYARARPSNFDVHRNWDLVRALITETDVEMIFLDRTLISMLREHAESQREDSDWIRAVFVGTGRRGPLLRHARGHSTHLHVRFFNPLAQTAAVRAWKILVDLGQLPPPVYYLEFVARKGDSLGKLSKRYGVDVPTLRRANGLRSNQIIAGVTYRVPRQGVRPAPAMMAPRVLPSRDPRPAPDSTGSNPISTKGTGAPPPDVASSPAAIATPGVSPSGPATTTNP
jgi:murein endopeptidase/LysM repeat protein